MNISVLFSILVVIWVVLNVIYFYVKRQSIKEKHDSIYAYDDEIIQNEKRLLGIGMYVFIVIMGMYTILVMYHIYVLRTSLTMTMRINAVLSFINFVLNYWTLKARLIRSIMKKNKNNNSTK